MLHRFTRYRLRGAAPALLLSLFAPVCLSAVPSVTLTGRARLLDFSHHSVGGATVRELPGYRRPIEGNFRLALSGLPAATAVELTLGNAEFTADTEGARVFMVLANGQPLLTDLDLRARFGLQAKADLRVKTRTDGQGRLELAFQPRRGNAQLAFLEVRDQAGAVLLRSTGDQFLPSEKEAEAAAKTPVARVPDPARVREIAALLSPRPAAPGHPADDRAAWEKVGASGLAERQIQAAERDLAEPTPVLTRELFETYKRTGTRSEYETPFRQRTDRLSRFTLAECLENRGRFLPAIEAELTAILQEETWVAPAHWFGHGGPDGVAVVDLASTARAWSLAVVDQWLGSRLKSASRAAIRREIEARIWRPYLASLRAGKPDRGTGWMRGSNNWNAVCHAGVIGSALALIEAPEERAEFVAGGEIYLPFFLNGFTADGYCSEGIGYWNYGFGSYLYLAEAVRQASGGRLDWLREPIVRAIATYPARLEIFDGIYPTYADGAPGTGPSPWMKDYLERRLSLGRPDWLRSGSNDLPMYHPLGATLFGAGTVLFIDQDTPAKPSAATAGGPGLRDEFSQAQVFTLRPVPGQPRFGVSFKGGHNDEHHNHNDLGSFVVALGRRTLLLDPGMEVYTSKTFGPKRYESRVLASYGHSVPVVAGKGQSPGRTFAAAVLERKFSDAQDEVTLDLTGGYAVPALVGLERTFTYRRGDAPALVVRDAARFSQPETLGTALVTFSRVKRTGPDRLLVYESDAAVEVLIDTGGAEFHLNDEVLPENLPGGAKTRRIGIDLVAPAEAPAITLTIRPAEPPVEAKGAVVTLPEGVRPDPARPTLRTEAEARSGEAGGRVDLVDRVNASGLGIRNWDTSGHVLSWKFQVVRPGRHAIRLRYALGGAAASERSAKWDGVPVVPADAPARFEPTGGWSSGSDDWREAWLGATGTALLLDLKAGEHTLELRNERGSLNLDWIELVPVR